VFRASIGTLIVLAGGCQFLSGINDYEVEPPPTRIDTVWSRSYGGPGDDGGNEVAIDSQNNVIAVGALGSTANFGGQDVMPVGGKDAFVVKLDRDGAYMWERLAGGDNDDASIDVVVDGEDNVIVAGLFTGEMDFGQGTLLTGPPNQRSLFVWKLTPKGEFVWAVPFVGFNAISIPFLAVGADGSIFVAGGLRGSVDFGGGPLTSVGSFDIYLLKLNPNGSYAWSTSFPSAMSVNTDPMFAPPPAGIQVDEDGSVLLAGPYETSISIFGDMRVGEVPRVWVARIAPGGNAAAWVKDFGADFVAVGDTTSLGGDQLLVAGSFAGALAIDGELYPVSGLDNADVFIARFDKNNGAHIDASTYHATVIREGDQVKSVTRVVTMDVNAQGDVLIAGALADTLVLGSTTLTAIGDTEPDLFAAKLDAQGTPLLAQRYGDAARDAAFGGELDDAGNVVVTGLFEGQLVLGADRHQTRGGADIFLVKLVPE
jgi:hypothetical protein